MFLKYYLFLQNKHNFLTIKTQAIMKAKIIVAMLLLLSLATNVMGQDGKNSLGRGYRGFVEVDIPGISTTHGYQFNPNIYAGIGIGAIVTMGGSGWYTTANFRYDATIKDKFTPFFDVKIYTRKGYKFDHIHPSIGYRFKHFNVKAGYLIQKGESNFLSLGIGFDFGGRKKK